MTPIAQPPRPCSFFPDITLAVLLLQDGQISTEHPRNFGRLTDKKKKTANFEGSLVTKLNGPYIVHAPTIDDVLSIDPLIGMEFLLA